LNSKLELSRSIDEINKQFISKIKKEFSNPGKDLSLLKKNSKIIDTKGNLTKTGLKLLDDLYQDGKYLGLISNKTPEEKIIIMEVIQTLTDKKFQGLSKSQRSSKIAKEFETKDILEQVRIKMQFCQ
jgi:hypothetical protein